MPANSKLFSSFRNTEKKSKGMLTYTTIVLNKNDKFLNEQLEEVKYQEITQETVDTLFKVINTDVSGGNDDMLFTNVHFKLK